MAELSPHARIRGRGSVSNPTGRFESKSTESFDDGWGTLDDDLAEGPRTRETHLHAETSKSILSHNQSPDIPFDQSINPYQGCEHGCVYCYARPTHAYWNHSPGIEFETEIYYKPDAARLLEEALRKPSYRVQKTMLGANTDPYQPSERKLEITRRILQVLLDFQHPISIITRSNLILRDLDLLTELSKRNLVSVAISITTLDRHLARTMEPRAPAPERRLMAVRRLSDAGIPVGVMTAPMILGLNEPELESLLEAAAEAGAHRAGYTLLRLPHELTEVFFPWLKAHYPEKADRIESYIRTSRDGALNDPNFGTRMRGTGPFAELLRNRFHLTCRRLGLNRSRLELDSQHFAPPARAGDQLRLFR